MAHVRIEWTANLEGQLDLRGLMEAIAAHLRDCADGAFPVGGIRVRALRVDDYVIADGKGPDDAFIHLGVTMGAGRSADFRQRYFDSLFAHVAALLADLFGQRPLAFSMYVDEAEGWKQNTIHHRLQKIP